MPFIRTLHARLVPAAVLLLVLGAAAAQTAGVAPATPSSAASRPAPGIEPGYLDSLLQGWPQTLVTVPSKPLLDSDMQARAQALSAELRPLLIAAARRWLDEVRAALPQADEPALVNGWIARMNNEMVTWMVSSPGAAREGIEWRLAQQPGYCRDRQALHEDQWALLAERLLFLQPLQGSEREAAIAVERQRWERWLTGGLVESGSPAPSPQLQAFQAAERQRAGEPVAPHPMTPWLSRLVFGERAPAPYAHLDVSCTLVQWWLANEVQRRSLSPQEAMRLFRYGTLPPGEDLLLMPADVRKRARAAAIDAFPPIAEHFGVTGATRVAVWLDAAGRVRDTQVTQRQLTMDGLAAGQVPLAFEQTLDRATFARVRAMRFDKPDPDKLRDGVVRRDMEFTWKLK